MLNTSFNQVSFKGVYTRNGKDYPTNDFLDKFAFKNLKFALMNGQVTGLNREYTTTSEQKDLVTINNANKTFKVSHVHGEPESYSFRLKMSGVDRDVVIIKGSDEVNFCIKTLPDDEKLGDGYKFDSRSAGIDPAGILKLLNRIAQLDQIQQITHGFSDIFKLIDR